MSGGGGVGGGGGGGGGGVGGGAEDRVAHLSCALPGYLFPSIHGPPRLVQTR